MKKRQVELDLLRIIALLAVISVHCTGMGTDALPMSDRNAQILLVFDCLVTWQIPVFVMISGRFFLDPVRNVSISKIKKAILRLVIAFVVWDVVYQTFYILTGAYVGLNWHGVISQALEGPYHFWYLFMLACMYAIVPFLRNITKSRKQMEWFICLFFLFEFLTSYGVQLPLVGSTLAGMLGNAKFFFPLGFTGYYILGYYLYKYPVPDFIEITLYILAMACLVIVSIISVHRAVMEGLNEEWYTGYLKPNTIIVASAIYTLFIKRISHIRFPDKAIVVITRLSALSFGVYLIHALVIEFIALSGMTVVMLSPFIMQPLVIVITFVICNIIVWLLRKIPYVGEVIT